MDKRLDAHVAHLLKNEACMKATLTAARVGAVCTCEPPVCQCEYRKVRP